MFVVEYLGCREKGDVDADQSGLETATVGTDANITASWRSGIRRTLPREEVIFHVESLWWKNVDAAQEEVVHLLTRVANRRCCCNHFGTNSPPIYFPRSQVVDDGF